MKKLICLIATLSATVLIAGCGGSSSAVAPGGGGGDSGAGTATLDSLNTVPSADLSNLDLSASAGSANLAVPISKSVGKTWGEEMREVGKTSRAGCEANMHKQEMIRMSQMVQISRCYPEAMEAAGFITIPTGSYNYYALTAPEDQGQETKVCETIPSQDAERKAACEGGDGGSMGGKEMKMRIGKIDGALQIDMCEGGSLIEEATHSASGSVYNITAIHSRPTAGISEKSRFEIAVDLGTDGYVTDGVVTLGSTGTATAIGRMVGGFGSGLMNFEAVGSDSSNKVYGAFAGSFTDPFTQAASSFTGKVYSHFGGAGNNGCAKYSFSGTMPPMRIQDMIPFGVSDSAKGDFLRAFGNELGIELTEGNMAGLLLCPNPDFNPESSGGTVKPMKVISAGETCGTVTHTGVECFEITNVTRQGDYGSTVSQSFTIIANSGSPYYDEVNAYSIAAFDPTVDTPAFVRSWDCTGSFQTIGFDTITPAQAAIMQTEVQKCRAIEEKAFANKGMGGHTCGKEEQMNGVDSFADGGGGRDDFGIHGGEYAFAESSEGKTNTCSRPGENGAPQRVGRLFVDKISDTQYCFPDGTGRCQSFTVANSVGTPDDTIAIDSWEITRIDYSSPQEQVNVKITYNTGSNPPSCVQYYTKQQHEFTKPQTFGATGEGTAPGEAGFVPDACKDASGNPVPENVCFDICGDPSANCRAGTGQGGKVF